MLDLMWLSVLPWGFVLLGLLPMWLFPRQINLYPGVVFLLAALILAATASLYARVPLGSQARFFWVMGLSVLANVLGVEAARDLAKIPEEIATAAGIGSLLASGLLLAGLYFLGRPVPAEEGGGANLRGREGVLGLADLQTLSESLEALSAVRPVTLLLLHTARDQNGNELLHYLRGPDMIFGLEPGHFLIALQGSGLDGAQIVFRRLRQNVPIRAYAVLPLQKMTVADAQKQLEGEIQHYYLTQQ